MCFNQLSVFSFSSSYGNLWEVTDMKAFYFYVSKNRKKRKNAIFLQKGLKDGELGSSEMKRDENVVVFYLSSDVLFQN